jgi:hypothetical protein
MQLHTPPVLDQPGFPGAIHPSQLTGLVRSSLTAGWVPHSAPCVPLSGTHTGSAADALEDAALLEQRYREHLARQALETLYAEGELSALAY